MRFLTDARLEPILVALKTGTGRPHGDGWERCVEQRAFIEQTLKSAKLSKVRRLLCARASRFPYATLHRFAVAELDFGRGAATIPVADGEPGTRLQLDTGWVGRLRRGPVWEAPPVPRVDLHRGALAPPLRLSVFEETTARRSRPARRRGSSSAASSAS